MKPAARREMQGGKGLFHAVTNALSLHLKSAGYDKSHPALINICKIYIYIRTEIVKWAGCTGVRKLGFYIQQITGHFIGGLDHFGLGGKSVFRLDKVHHLAPQIHAGSFQGAGDYLPK